MVRSSKEVRELIEANWREYLAKYANLFSSSSLSGSSPPSVFVGSAGYPKVNVGPMVPPIHGDTSILDLPENWLGKNLEEIVNFRLHLVRGIRKIPIFETESRYLSNLQEIVMSSSPIDSDIEFHNKTIPVDSIDGESAPFGPLGNIKNAKFSYGSSDKSIENVYYDVDLGAQDAVLQLYNNGIEISKIQKCFSIGMFGKKRRLVPTRWSITATDDIISKNLVSQIIEYDIIDTCQVFSYEHLGNLFSIIIFPHIWIFEMEEAWHTDGEIGFGTDYEGVKGIGHPPQIAGAYFAAKLAVAEYLKRKQKQAGVLVLREIKPEYAVPVGVWQIREGIRQAMKQQPILANNFDESVSIACNRMSISKSEWLSKGKMYSMLQQRSLTDFF